MIFAASSPLKTLPVAFQPGLWRLSNGVVAATTATAALLAMLADTMTPEAFADAHNFAGFIIVAGFLTALILTKTESAP
jgi:hypothetical protein